MSHVDAKAESPATTVSGPPHPHGALINPVLAHVASGLASNSLLMTCRIVVNVPDGSTVEARALLGCASSASFVLERLTQSLNYDNHWCCWPFSSMSSPSEKFDVTAVVVPRVTCDLPLHPHPILLDRKWKHLSDIQLADPTFGCPGRIDRLVGVDVFVEVPL